MKHVNVTMSLFFKCHLFTPPSVNPNSLPAGAGNGIGWAAGMAAPRDMLRPPILRENPPPPGPGICADVSHPAPGGSPPLPPARSTPGIRGV